MKASDMNKNLPAPARQLRDLEWRSELLDADGFALLAERVRRAVAPLFRRVEEMRRWMTTPENGGSASGPAAAPPRSPARQAGPAQSMPQIPQILPDSTDSESLPWKRD